MDTVWSELANLINGKNLSNASWRSDQKALLKIFNYANEQRLPEPPGMLKVSFSNLREIISEAKKAVRRGDNQRLLELFTLAATMTIRDLRRALNKLDIDDIEVEKKIIEGKKMIVLRVTQDQFERIQKSTEQHFRFITKEA